MKRYGYQPNNDDNQKNIVPPKGGTGEIEYSRNKKIICKKCKGLCNIEFCLGKEV